MNPIYLWLIGYALPILIGGVLLKILPKSKQRPSVRNGIIIHGTLILSTFASQYFLYTSGYTFPWHPKSLSIFVYILSIFISIRLIGKLGVGYTLSALVQEFTITSITFLLLQVLPLSQVILLVVPIFVFGHTLRMRHWQIRILLFAIWGTISVCLFSVLQDVYLLVAMHTLLGAFFISRSIIYPTD